eukprot:GAHX01003044.1.p1 GENE.GAHX01003044.1~~GAHX01003044.1.p1  ORF type:complete len:365 (+),score=44.55 GAHX01003044.1:151-1245(+)
MILAITLPILISNILTTSIAFWKVHHDYKSTVLKPRLLLVILLILADIPGSILTVIISMVNSNILSNKYICYFYMAFNFMWTLKVFSLIGLALLVSFIVFGKFSIYKLTTIGYIMNSVVLGVFLFVELVLLPLTGAKPKHDFEIDGNIYFRHCGAGIKWVDSGFFMFQFLTSLLTVFTACVLLTYIILYKKFRKGNHFKRIFASFLCFSLINCTAMLQYFIEIILGIRLTKYTRYILLDCEKIVPSLFSISYILLESFSHGSKIDFGIRNILENDRPRALLREYFESVSQRKQVEFVKLWETINNSERNTISIFGRSNLTKKQALCSIEETLKTDLGGFYMTEEFNNFFDLFKKSGKIEVGLFS